MPSPHRLETEDAVRALVKRIRRVAVLGIKTEAQSDQPAFYVPEYLASVGLEVIPVPVYYPEVKEILGRPVYRRLVDVPGELDLVDVFRRPKDLEAHLDDILAKAPKAVWFQAGIRRRRDRRPAGRGGHRRGAGPVSDGRPPSLRLTPLGAKGQEIGRAAAVRPSSPVDPLGPPPTGGECQSSTSTRSWSCAMANPDPPTTSWTRQWARTVRRWKPSRRRQTPAATPYRPAATSPSGIGQSHDETAGEKIGRFFRRAMDRLGGNESGVASRGDRTSGVERWPGNWAPVAPSLRVPPGSARASAAGGALPRPPVARRTAPWLAGATRAAADRHRGQFSGQVRVHSPSGRASSASSAARPVRRAEAGAVPAGVRRRSGASARPRARELERVGRAGGGVRTTGASRCRSGTAAPGSGSRWRRVT